MKRNFFDELTTEELQKMIGDSVTNAFLKLKSLEESKKDKLLSRQEAAIFIQPPIQPPTKKSDCNLLCYSRIYFYSEVPGGFEPPYTVLQTAA